MGRKKSEKIILPPELSPEIPNDEVEVSDEDLQFVQHNRQYALGFSRLDTQSITNFYTFGRFTFANLCQSKRVFRRVVKVEGKNMIVKKYDIIEEKFMSKVEKAEPKPMYL